MTHGKEICQQLKAVLIRIAEENGIALDIPECTHHGPCRGTCPRCEAEVRYLENALAERLRLGKVATVAGLALTLAAPVNALAQIPVALSTEAAAPIKAEMPQMQERIDYPCPKQNRKTVLVKGTVIDDRTKEPIPFARVVIRKEDDELAVTFSDLDGNFTIEIPSGKYTLETGCVGYMKKTMPLRIPKKKEDLNLGTISMELSIMGLYQVEIIQGTVSPIDLSSPGIIQENENDGIKVKVQY